MRSLFLLFTLLVSASGIAQKILVANCTEGGGCSFELSDIDAELFGDGFGRNIEPNDILVFGEKKNGEQVQYLDKKSRSAIDREWGGDGFTQIGLFNPRIQPTNGLWKVSYGNSTGNDCYGIGNIGAYIRKIIAPGRSGSGQIRFGFPFHPRQLFPSTEMRWVKTGFNTYKGILDFNSNSSGGMKLFYFVTLVDQAKIETQFSMEIKVPTKELCIGKIPVTYTLIAAEETEDSFGEEGPADDDLLPVNPGSQEDDLLPVNPSDDDLLPIKTGQQNQPNVPIIGDDTPNVPLIED